MRNFEKTRNLGKPDDKVDVIPIAPQPGQFGEMPDLGPTIPLDLSPEDRLKRSQQEAENKQLNVADLQQRARALNQADIDLEGKINRGEDIARNHKLLADTRQRMDNVIIELKKLQG